MSITITTARPNRRTLLAYGGALASTAALSACTTSTGVAAGLGEKSADLILENGIILTQDSSRPIAGSIAIRDGRVLATGRGPKLDQYVKRGTKRVNLGGRTVIPGLNDSHMHPTRGGRFYASELRWDGLTSLSRGLDMIAEAAKTTPRGQWVRVVGGWSPHQFSEKRMPTPAELTRAAPNTPVYVLFLYSQGFLNAAAVRERGLRRGMETPPGTAYEFTPDGGAIIKAEPNPDLLYATIGGLPPLSEAEQLSSTKHFYRELNRLGLTSVIDAGGGGHKFPKDYGASDALANSGDLTLRISNYLFPQDKGKELAEFDAWTRANTAGKNLASGLDNGYVVEGGGEFLVWAAGDFENFLAGRPDITEREDWDIQLMAVTRHLLQKGWPLRIHATYDESINHILDVFERADRLEIAAGRKGFSAIRWAIDHAETAQPETLARIHRLGGGVAVQARMAYAGEFFLERYGREMTQSAPPLRDIIEAGLPLGLGSDATRVASYNPWNTLYWATTGRSIGGTQLHGPRQRLTREEALYHHTVGSAWLSQEEGVKGRLAPGQYADIAVLNAPYLTVGDDELMSIESELTLVGGDIVHSSGSFDGMAPKLDPILPSWSPVRRFGGYQS